MPSEEPQSPQPAALPLRGVTLEQYAGVRAALAEEFPLKDILANEEFDPATWPEADAAWKVRLATDGPGGALFQAYRVKLGEAEDWLTRSVPPLDSDLEAWLSFLRVWSESAEPFALMQGAGLRMNDIARLQRRWSRRMEVDAALQKRAAELTQKGPRPMPAIRADAAELKAFPWSKWSKGKSPAEARPKRSEGLHETAPLRDIPRGPVLPFAKAEASPPEAPSPRVASSAAAVLTPAEKRKRLGEASLGLNIPRQLPPPAPLLTLEQHACLCVEIATTPERTAETLARYRLTPALKEQADRHWREEVAKHPELRAAWNRTYQHHYRWLVEHGRAKG